LRFPAMRLRPDQSAGWLVTSDRRRSDTVRCSLAAPPSMDWYIFGSPLGVNSLLKKLYNFVAPTGEPQHFWGFGGK
jgi:hypothetical protein